MKKKSSKSSASARKLTASASMLDSRQVNAANNAEQKTLKEAFESIEKIRRRAKPLPEGMTIKDLIEERRI